MYMLVTWIGDRLFGLGVLRTFPLALVCSLVVTQVLARGMKRELPHPAAGVVPMAASPLKFSDSPVEYRRAPPMLGEHTAQVLSERLGLSQEEIQALAQSGG